jgi:hypothetical protein
VKHLENLFPDSKELKIAKSEFCDLASSGLPSLDEFSQRAISKSLENWSKQQ